MKYFVTVNDKGTFWHKDAEMTIFHREEGPAISYQNGYKCWYINGELHRIDGPAIERDNGDEWWYLNGQEMTEEEFNDAMAPATELTVDEIEKLLGKRIKIVK